MRLIDADEVLKKMDLLTEKRDTMIDFYSGLDTGRDLIENAIEERANMKITEYRFRAKPYKNTYEYLEDQQYFDDQWQEWVDSLPDGVYDGEYVYGWYVDGYIVGDVMEVGEDWITLEYYVPITSGTLEMLFEEVQA